MTELLNIEEAETLDIDGIGSDNRNDRIAKDFLRLLEQSENNELPDGTVSDQQIAKAGVKLLTVLYKLHDVSVGSGFSKAIDMKPDDRNFFVTPDDLYLYAIDFVDMGSFDDTVF